MWGYPSQNKIFPSTLYTLYIQLLESALGVDVDHDHLSLVATPSEGMQLHLPKNPSAL